MYSPKLLAILQGIGVHSEIEVTTKTQKLRGLLMPSSGDPNYLVLKLSNGYNVGIPFDPALKARKLSEPKTIPKPELEMPASRGTECSIILTGGTVTSRVDYKTGGVTSLSTPEELLNSVPEISNFIKLQSVEAPFTRMSESINYEDWIELAKLTEKKLKENQSVIIAHGTDTLHYTSAALAFMLQNPSKPVVLTGSQRSSDRGSTDALMNLFCSASIAASNLNAVGVCMHASSNDDFCFFTNGTKVRKMHTSRRDTFRPINTLPYAAIYPNGSIEKISQPKSGRLSSQIGFDPYTALIKFTPGSFPKVLDWYVKEGAKGVIIEATGLGQIAIDTRTKLYSWYDSIKSAIDSGVFVGFAPQTIYGALNENVYSEARRYKDIGVVFLKDMLPETAYVKLGWVLSQTKNKVSEMMLTNYVGEFSDRILPETFLY